MLENKLNLLQVENLIKESNTPFYVIFQKKIKENIENLFSSLSAVNNLKIYYSFKTNFEGRLLQAIKELGVGADVSSPLDLHMALEHKFSGEKIVIDNLNNFSDSDLERAISHDVYIINIENLIEAQRVNAIALKLGKEVNLGIRVNLLPYHQRICGFKLGTFVKKFGMEEELVLKFVNTDLKTLKNVKLKGLFSHYNLLFFTTPENYCNILKRLFCLAVKINRLGFSVDELNIGGGFPNPSMEYFNFLPKLIKKISFIYFLENKIKSNFYNEIAVCFRKLSNRFKFEPALAIEPGRALVDNAAVIVGKIIQESGGQIITDISADDLGFSYILKKRRLLFLNSKHEKNTGTKIVNICGPSCRFSDVLFVKARAPKECLGLNIVIFDCGAYAMPRSVQHFRPRRPVFFIDSSGKVSLVREEGKIEDCF